MSIKRITKQFNKILKNPPPNIVKIQLNSPENYQTWLISLQGPEGTPYENGIFFVQINFPNNYPFESFKMKFITKIYHPNINSDGQISTDHDKGLYCSCGYNWSPALSVQKILPDLLGILTQPNPNDCLVPEIARQYKDDRDNFNKTARQWTNKYAHQ